MTGSAGLITAMVFVWLGMVLAISFLEAPLKFRAPGVTTTIGLGIGRLVFKALNAFEALFAIVIVVAAIVDAPDTGAVIAFAVAIGALVVQLVGVRPALMRRSDQVLAGADDLPRSHVHFVYVGLELVKVAALIVSGVLLLTA